MLHIRMGYFEELIASLSKEYKKDPLNEHIAWALSDALLYSGKPAEAIEILSSLQYFSYRQYYLALAEIYVGDYEQARPLLRDVRMRSGVLPAAYADLIIDAMESPARKEEVSGIIVTATRKGELDKLVGFESLLMLGSAHAYDLGIDPSSDLRNAQIIAQVWNNWAVEVRRDPRFKEWVTKTGFLGFWRKNGWPDRCRPTGPDNFECI